MVVMFMPDSITRGHCACKSHRKSQGVSLSVARTTGFQVNVGFLPTLRKFRHRYLVNALCQIGNRKGTNLDCPILPTIGEGTSGEEHRRTGNRSSPATNSANTAEGEIECQRHNQRKKPSTALLQNITV